MAGASGCSPGAAGSGMGSRSMSLLAFEPSMTPLESLPAMDAGEAVLVAWAESAVASSARAATAANRRVAERVGKRPIARKSIIMKLLAECRQAIGYGPVSGRLRQGRFVLEANRRRNTLITAAILGRFGGFELKNGDCGEIQRRYRFGIIAFSPDSNYNVRPTVPFRARPAITQFQLAAPKRYILTPLPS